MKKTMNKSYLRDDLKDFIPYRTVNIPHTHKMNANEGPWDLPSVVKSALIDIINGESGYNIYPDSDSTSLRRAIAKYEGVSVDEVMIGNGSDEMIRLSINAFAKSDDNIIIPDPTFEMYEVFSKISGCNVIKLPLKDDFKYDTMELLDILDEIKPKVVFLCTPSNPTGNAMPKSEIRTILDAVDGVVVVDEAYTEFSGETMIDEINDYPNLLIIRTFSKAWGIAGLRIGYAISNKHLLSDMWAVKTPYNIDKFAQMTAELLLENSDIIKKRIEILKAERERIIDGLSTLHGIIVFPSVANFVLFRFDNTEKAAEMMLDAGVLLRKYSNGVLNNCLRVSVGRPEENSYFLDKFNEVYAKL